HAPPAQRREAGAAHPESRRAPERSVAEAVTQHYAPAAPRPAVDAGVSPRAIALPGDDEIMGRVREAWQEVLERIGVARPMLKPCLLEGTPVSCEARIVTVEFAEEQWWHCESLENPRNKQFVQKMLGERVGGEISIRFQVRKAAEKAEPEARPPVPRKDVSNLKKNPLIQSAIEMFQAQVVEIRK
ncbi:MAG: hypothetical protein NT045_00080, partial [Candidatus Aureabacteria bacterium]|nr:hypothetical protein [Candidatus Auribacterota bacterium]